MIKTLVFQVKSGRKNQVYLIPGRKWQRLLAHEREQRLRLEEMVEQLAR